jgi:hypothetical protein
MDARAIWEDFDVLKDGTAGRLSGGEAVSIDEFDLEPCPEALSAGVFMAMVTPAHADGGLKQALSVVAASILTAPVALMD